jgi:hypothetical protein
MCLSLLDLRVAQLWFVEVQRLAFWDSDWSLYVMRPLQNAYIRPPIASIPLCPEDSPMSFLLERRPLSRKLPPLPDHPRPCTERSVKIHDEPEVVLTTVDFAEVLEYLYERPDDARSLHAGHVKFLADEHPLLFSYIVEVTKIAKIRQLLSARSSADTRDRVAAEPFDHPTRPSPKNASHPLTTVTNNKPTRNVTRASTSAALATSSSKPSENVPNIARRTSGRVRKPTNGSANMTSDEGEGGSEGEDVAAWFKTKDGAYECPICQHRLKRPNNLKSESWKNPA